MRRAGPREGAAPPSRTPAIAPRNQLNAQGNKTLRTRCAACDAEITTDAGNDPFDRPTWALVGSENGRPRIFPTCASCYGKGWRPPGEPS